MGGFWVNLDLSSLIPRKTHSVIVPICTMLLTCCSTLDLQLVKVSDFEGSRSGGDHKPSHKSSCCYYRVQE